MGSSSSKDASNTKDSRHLVHRMAGVLRRNPIKSIAFTGLVATAGHKYWIRGSVDGEDSENETTVNGQPAKKVLLVPFHRIKLVEDRKRDFQAVLQSKVSKLSASKDGDDGTTPIEMEVHELVQLIHTAASDPSIVALYGTFGHGFGFASGGWAHIEEVRNALRVFRESHRVHREPNFGYDPILKRNCNGTRKPLYAYADTFSSPMTGAKEFYLASAFTHVQLQPQGDVSLFGMHATNLFFKEFLDKYGIQVHVFKHGLYKNFANMFTDRRYTKEHKENVENIVQSINDHVCQGIYQGRKNLSTYDSSNFWHMVHNAGSLSASVAHGIGFVDYMPKFDPLEQLVESNKSEEDKKLMKEKWGKDTDMDQFAANKVVSITQYSEQLAAKKKAKERKWNIHDQLHKTTEDHPALATALSAVGYNAPHFNISKEQYSEDTFKSTKEKIAVLKIGGAITDVTARRIELAIRKLKKAKDVKCLVLRVDSPGGGITACETILQELKDLPQHVVVSFGNTSASGGYYISTAADRIFASPTTITGSIGVFMLKMDLRGLAAQFGIKSDSVTTSALSGIHDPFYPMNGRMKEDLANFSDRAYLHFKTLVSEGRGIDLETVESVAAGRVFCGQQAKELGLVDELGGLDRAISFAQRTYTETGDAKVIAWPPQKSLFDFLTKKDAADVSDTKQTLAHTLASLLTAAFSGEEVDLTSNASRRSSALDFLKLPSSCSGVMLTLDENSAIRCLLEQNELDIGSEFPDDFWV